MLWQREAVEEPEEWHRLPPKSDWPPLVTPPKYLPPFVSDQSKGGRYSDLPLNVFQNLSYMEQTLNLQTERIRKRQGLSME